MNLFFLNPLNKQAKIPKITDFGLWDFKNFFMEETGQPLVYFNPYQAPEVSLSSAATFLFLFYSYFFAKFRLS